MMSTLPFLPANLTHLVFVVDHAPGHSFQPEPPRQRMRRSTTSSRQRSSVSSKSDEMDSSNFSVSSAASTGSSGLESCCLSINSGDASIQRATVPHRGSPGMKSAPKKPRRRNTPPAGLEASTMEDHQKPQRRGSMECHQKQQRRGSLARSKVSHMGTSSSIHKSGLTF
ncbi:hypothetical protein SEMRO_622_G177020.1 [Seminavis robusta]|uniref:Uncharacterized protein n=1 Tax=Seminavis robusta TaxID=568900 RepID=A0A9N8HGA9_9STRA|nr:hypothetical protein SEMRO_622_G177020.1 [Seminavis robusta]|eukprot:Sro622_g177020.1 n/a (169) ;mRNA; f:43006-43512